MAVVGKLPPSTATGQVGARWLCGLALVFLLGACAQFAPLAKRGGTEPDIRKQRQLFNEAIALRRMANLGALVSDDTQQVEPSRIITGRKNLIRAYEGLVQKRPDLLLIFTPDTVERNPRWTFAAERGRWYQSWQDQGESVEVHGSYYALWKLKDGRWRIHTQIVTPVTCTGTRYCKAQE